jgi:hypothetical protein
MGPNLRSAEIATLHAATAGVEIIGGVFMGGAALVGAYALGDVYSGVVALFNEVPDSGDASGYAISAGVEGMVVVVGVAAGKMFSFIGRTLSDTAYKIT